MTPGLRDAAIPGRGMIALIFLFSSFINLLMLSGPLYMLQIYDRVLVSRSEETLVALSVLTLGLFLVMGLLDHMRGRILMLLGARLQDRLDGAVFAAALAVAARQPGDRAARAAPQDVEAVQRLFAAPVMAALFDIPWTPLFIGLIFVFHPLMGALALASVAGLALLTLAARRMAAGPTGRALCAGQAAELAAAQMLDSAETLRALGMAATAGARWHALRDAALEHGIAAAAVAGGFAAASRTLRLLLQSAMLGLGAFLVLRQGLGPGVMIAASILMGRALAPIETAIGQWPQVQRARDGWLRLSALLAEGPALPRRPLPRPAARLEVAQLSLCPVPGRLPALHGLSLSLGPGQALGVIGPSGAGKSSLARALTGALPPAAGTILLDGIALDRYPAEDRGRFLGYLPQQAILFDGTVAENIARLAADPDPAAVVRAARIAGAHEMIAALPQGYDTALACPGRPLSGGQIQRIGLARALFGDPVLLVLDEPNSSLDHDGSMALNHAIRTVKAAGSAVLVMAHRPAAIQDCDLLLVLEGGQPRAFGPRDRILRELVRNHDELVARSAGAG